MSTINFTSRDWMFIYAAIALCALAIVLFQRKKTTAAVFALMLSGPLLRVVMLTVDPFLHIWDEQYHALVAKNLAEHFCTPTLVEHPLQELPAAGWTYTHHWLHKPPLFLWQMALAIKMFGAEPWVVRIPSCLLTTLMIPVVLRMGILLSNERVGFIAALLFAFSNILLCLTTGMLNTDHNDLAFLAYTCFSIWAWMEHISKPSARWIILIGLFAGAAVLTKWLPGMMVFGAWFVSIVVSKERTGFPKWRDMAFSIAVCILVAAPWFLYARIMWPESFHAAMAIYSDHFSDNMTHEGSWWFHFGTLVVHNGWLFTMAALLSTIAFCLGNARKEYKFGLIGLLIVVYGFYSFVPARMPLFCLPMLPLLFIIISYTLDHLANKIKPEFLSRVFLILVVAILVSMPLTIDRWNYTYAEHGMFNAYRDTRIHNRKVYEESLVNLPPNALLYNCPLWNAVPCMFYTGVTASDQLPTEEQLALAKEAQRPVYILNDGKLPESLMHDSTITILDTDVIRNGY